MSITLVSLAFLSCWDYSLPNRIELEVEGSVDLPVRITASDWGSLLTETLKRAFSGAMENVIGVEVYNVNYGQEVQAFCVYFPIKISDSLNPKDYLDGINLTQMDGSALKIDESVEVPSFDSFTLSCQVNEIIDVPSDLTIPYDKPIEITGLSDEANLSSISTDFLHALIGEGCFDISLDLSKGNVILAKDEFEFKYNINISQDKDGPYEGFAYSSSTDNSLAGQNVNKKPVRINASVTLQPKAGGGKVTLKNSGASKNLEGQLIIKMNIKKFSEVDLDITNISNKLKNPEPVSLADAAKYLNYIKFDSCAVNGEGEATEGIGINMYFTDIIDGLKMTITCPELSFNSEAKSIQKGNNIFGNKEELRLQLTGAGGKEKLNFNVNLSSDTSTNVLHLTNLTVGKPLKIQGEAKLFQHWVEAEVNISDTFEEQFPDKDEKPINLSLLDDYFKGFKFNNVEAAAYFSGPVNIFKKIKTSLKIDVRYSTIETTVMKEDPITFEKNQIVIADYLDAKGAYKKKELPLNGKNPIDFVTVLNSQPNDLVFHYFIDVSGTDIITPDLFVDNNEAVSHDIFVTIMLLIHLDLTAGDGGGRIMFPDMFNKDQKDLLGRKTLEEDSKFTSLNVDYINFTVDFTSQFFTGGKLFIEKDEPILFPNGIPLNGRKISINIRNKELDLIRNKLIPPDFRLEFKPGEKIVIPKNIGVTSVKIEAKGKNTIKLDF